MIKTKKVAITTGSFGENDFSALTLLEKNNFQVIKNNLGRTLVEEEIIALCDGCSGVIAGTEIYDYDTLRRLQCLRVISRVGVGMDNIDLIAADKLGVKVVNTPLGPINAVAELTVGLMLNLLRRISFMDSGIRVGRWQKVMGNLLNGKKVGIIGYGRIGRKVAELLKALGCDVAYYDVSVKNQAENIRSMQLDELLAWADIISIHVSGKAEILGEKELKHMKKGAWLVNVSRGGTVDEDCLYFCLKSGQLSGAAVDVFAQEPYKGILKDLDNVILTPHIGSYAIEARVEMEKSATENLIKILKEV